MKTLPHLRPRALATAAPSGLGRSQRLLLRAQLALTVSFLFAGAAQSLPEFTAALALQGLPGGTFAASNGYLTAALDGLLTSLIRRIRWSH